LSSEELAHSVWRKIRCTILPTKVKPNLCAEIRQTLFAICTICAHKNAA